MQDNKAQLAALVGSRLCHDLISPVGAIQNGLELLSLSGGSADASPEMALITDSCASATARIQFFRVAFGMAGEAQKLGPNEARALLGNLTRDSRLNADWQPAGELARIDVQLAFLALLCCEAGLPQGGTVTLEGDGAALRIGATGPRIAAEPDLWGALAGPTSLAEITPGKVQFAYLALLAQDQGRTLHTDLSDDGIEITIRT